MRKNIFLDFLSPDNWKTYATVPKDPNTLRDYTSSLILQLRQSINAAILLTPQYCLLPPAFIVQSNVAFRAVFECSLYLDEHLIYLPLREISIDQYIAKKISEYERVKDNHLGFYNEDHWTFLSKYQNLLIHRNSTMGITIATQWIILSDNSAIWKPIVERNPWAAERLRPIPMLLKERGESVTLEAVLAESKSSFRGLSRFVNQAIQHEYLKAYISEYNASILSNAPPKPLNENYLIPIDSCYYDFRLFSSILDLMDIKHILLDASPETIVNFIHDEEYDKLVDMYWEICNYYHNTIDVLHVFKELVGTAKTNQKKSFFIFPSTVIRFQCTNFLKQQINRVFDAWQNKKNILTSCSYGGIGMLTPNQKVFIVHGHDTDKRNQVELFIRRVGLDPIILCNEPSKGKTIIDKFESYSDVSFAIVLYTACDEGREKGKVELFDRARQNVVFEHGFFCSKLGRENVVALHEAGVELPGDLSGVVYISFESNWKDQLKKEMAAAGIKANWLQG